jgi:ABC-type nitrate/sulfonate/bicarbonate transport system permease component
LLKAWPARYLVAVAARLGPILIFMGLWQVFTMLRLTDPAFLPDLGAIGLALADLLRSKELFINLGVSLLTSMAGLALGIVIGVPLGMLMALSKAADGFFGPLVKATYSLPKSALIPLFILWFGVGGMTNILAVTLTALLPIVIYTYHGVHGVPRIFVWSAESLGTPRWKMLLRILLPASSHAILTGIRIALGFSFIITIAAEMIVSNYGIGKLMFQFGDSGAYNYMFAAIITVVLVAYLADFALMKLTDYILRWQDPVEKHG